MVRSTSDVVLEKITAATLGRVIDLEVTPSQRDCVASNAVSIAEAHFNPGAWLRAVYSGGDPVGFVMLFDPTIPGAIATDPIEPTDMFLWRLMIDRRYQRRGLGRCTLDLVMGHVRQLGRFRQLVSSFVHSADLPRAFYLSYGFKETGRLIDGKEIEIALRL